jgi:prevent-host-death family protein
MKTTSIRDLHIRTSELVREAEEGTVIVIERRGEPVAELRPLAQAKKRVTFPDMTEFWARMPQVPGDSGKYLEEDR